MSVDLAFVSLHRMLTLLILSLHFVTLSAQSTNSVIEQPFVSCATDAIYAKWKTQQTFTGRVNIRYSPNRFCYQVLVTNNQVELLIPHLDCRISRIRSLNPPGLLLETTVLVSFHPEFVTEQDRLFVLRCLHTKNATQGGLNEGVPQPLTAFPTNNPQLDTSTVDSLSSGSNNDLRCSYVVVHEETGKPVKTVKIGEPVRHEWQCSGTRENQCLIVTNCFIKTVDSQHELIDQFGCSKDPNLIANLKYDGKTSVRQHARVFGVAEKPFVFYQCEMNLVDVDFSDHSCPKPKCTSSSSTRQTREANLTSLPLALVPIFDVLSQQIEVLPLGAEQWSEKECLVVANSTDDKAESDANELNIRHTSNGLFCLAWPVFLLGSMAFAIMMFTTGVLLTIGTLKRGKYHDVAQA